MNNETTASQPKSIGDDAQFLELLKSVGRAIEPSQEEFFISKLVELIDSRDPAAQASATIQAAPVGWRDKLRWSKANTDMHGYIAFTPAQLEHFVSMLCSPAATIQAAALPAERMPNSSDPRDEAHAAGWNACLASIRATAAIQEPVMVVELAAAQFKMPGETWEECSIDEEDAMRARGYKFRYLYTHAAPMVADPAGVAVPEGYVLEAARNGIWITTSHGVRAFVKDADYQPTSTVHGLLTAMLATVKAVPSNYHDAYRGARDDLADWKRRALEAERKLAHALDEINGPTFMGEPAKAVPSEALDADKPDYQGSDGNWYHGDGVMVGGVIGADGCYLRDLDYANRAAPLADKTGGDA